MSDVPVLGHAGGRVDLLIRQGATFSAEVTLTNPDGTAVDLAGATVRAQMRRKALDANPPLATFTVTMIDAAGGVFSFSLTDAQTAALVAAEDPAGIDSRAVWDMELLDAAGRVTPVYYGKVTIHREVTRP
jgi:hypothetical protein